ncbi:Pol [Symbiodinium sp. CCMP2456]|nr:Pol [Symbiodinium sp. CCMP2456]
MLQESHWADQCAQTFNSGRWKVITSPATDNQSAGVVTLIDRELCGTGQLLHSDPVPGRLLHVRLQRQDWTLDTYNLYQRQTGQGKATADEDKDIRSWWQVTSTALFEKDYHMVQGNSWQRHAGTTYYHPKGQALIDHVLLRKPQCDQRAKTAKPIKTSLAAWRQGSYHLPILCSLPVHRFHSLNKPKQPRREWNHWDLKYPHSHAAAAGLPQAEDATAMNALLCRCAAKVFPPQTRPQRLAAWQTQPMTIGIKGMWQAYAQWKRHARRGRDAIFEAWRSYSKFRKAQRDFRTAGKQARKQWFSDRLQDLQQAAARKDMRALFAGVRTMAPKKKKSEIQLKDKDGYLQSAEVQLQQLRTHYQQVYKREPQKPPPKAQAPLRLEVEEDEVRQALSSLVAHKATPLRVNSDVEGLLRSPGPLFDQMGQRPSCRA